MDNRLNIGIPFKDILNLLIISYILFKENEIIRIALLNPAEVGALPVRDRSSTPITWAWFFK